LIGKSSKTTEGDANVIQVDYSNEGSTQQGLTGVDVVISTIPGTAVDIQVNIAAAAKKAGVKLFVPSEFAGISEGESEGMGGEKANVQAQLRALELPYAAFYTGEFSDQMWLPYVS